MDNLIWVLLIPQIMAFMTLIVIGIGKLISLTNTKMGRNLKEFMSIED